jgi:hypothetical protein
MFSMWKYVALPIRIRLINNPAWVHTLWVAIIHRGGRGSKIVVRKLRVYVNGMLWLRERLPLACLEPGERESAPIWRIQTGVLHSGVMGQARCWCDYLKIDYRESRGDSPLSIHRDWQLIIGVVLAVQELFCARWNSLSFHMSNHCRHQACSQRFPSFLTFIFFQPNYLCYFLKRLLYKINKSAFLSTDRRYMPII